MPLLHLAKLNNHERMMGRVWLGGEKNSMKNLPHVCSKQCKLFPIFGKNNCAALGCARLVGCGSRQRAHPIRPATTKHIQSISLKFFPPLNQTGPKHGGNG